MVERPPRVLVIGGSDSSGGAGVQADIRTISLMGGYAGCAVTAVTVQDTRGVHAVHAIPAPLVGAQASAMLGDIGADSIKIGMLGGAATAAAVVHVLGRAKSVPVVLDPVMIAKGGARLLSEDAVAFLRDQMLPLAALLTPNAPEAEALTGLAIETTDDLRRAGEVLLRLGSAAVLMKGGHLAGEGVTDVLMHAHGERLFDRARLATRHTHGTGCTLASACAIGLARGMDLEAAVAAAIRYTARAIAAAPGLGAGHGPLGPG